jgi:hypothetical protein
METLAASLLIEPQFGDTKYFPSLMIYAKISTDSFQNRKWVITFKFQTVSYFMNTTILLKITMDFDRF